MSSGSISSYLHLSLMRDLSVVPRSTHARLSTIDRRKEPVDVFKDSFAAQHDVMVLFLLLLCLIPTKRLKVFLHCFCNNLLFWCPGR
jgi:hypothetical protein